VDDMKNENKHIITQNKKASFSYTLSDFFICGIQLQGSEIKSIRLKQVNISESFCIVNKNEIYIKNMDIEKYKFCCQENYKAKRERKLLLNKNEIRKIKKSLDEKGMTIIPTKLLINQKGFAKIEIAIGKGKKTYDKRQSLKAKDAKLEIEKQKRIK
tara:strand:- start:820 stop:1290 length:471 start_codon:yes stop_codon:yes gene_type:complete